MTWQRLEITSKWDSCHAYWNTLQDLGSYLDDDSADSLEPNAWRWL